MLWHFILLTHSLNIVPGLWMAQEGKSGRGIPDDMAHQWCHSEGGYLVPCCGCRVMKWSTEEQDELKTMVA